MRMVPFGLPGLVVVEPSAFADSRGWFMETFNEAHFESKLSELGLPAPGRFVQDNLSCSSKAVLRGLHYQLPPFAQGKLVRVMSGSVFDVAVDIRVGSPTYGRWVGLELSAKNKKAFWIPAGFAHGFIALEDNTYFSYKVTNYYDRESERALKWNDPDVGIVWPAFNEPIISEKDEVAPMLSDIDPLNCI